MPRGLIGQNVIRYRALPRTVSQKGGVGYPSLLSHPLAAFHDAATPTKVAFCAGVTRPIGSDLIPPRARQHNRKGVRYMQQTSGDTTVLLSTMPERKSDWNIMAPHQ
jgi:hypothetical protein